MKETTCAVEASNESPGLASVWLTKGQICRLVRDPPLSTTTLWRYVKAGRFPTPEYPFGPPPQPPLWRRSHVDAFLADPVGWRAAHEVSDT